MKRKDVSKMSNVEVDKTVKIQGTKFDRKRKIGDDTINQIKYLRSCGKTLSAISREVGVSAPMVRYYTDAEYRYKHCHMGGTHAQSEVHDLNERADYKRRLMRAGARVIYPMD